VEESLGAEGAEEQAEARSSGGEPGSGAAVFLPKRGGAGATRGERRGCHARGVNVRSPGVGSSTGKNSPLHTF
jgi:hypothetical protein